MQRRKFLRGLTAGGAALTLTACTGNAIDPEAGAGAEGEAEDTDAEDTASEEVQAPAQNSSMPSLRWRMATSWPQSLDTIFGGAEDVAKGVAELTEGRFEIEAFAGGEIVPALEVLDAVQQGTVEMGHTAAYYYVGKNNAFAFATAVPFGLNAQQQNAWIYHGGGFEALAKLYADFSTIHFPAGNTGVQMGGWFRNEINTVEDLQGLRMRIPGLGGQVMEALGVATQTISGGDIFVSLERGAIDAAEWVGPYDDEKLGLNQAAEFYYYPGWWEPGPTLDVLINQSQWEQLPALYQSAIRIASYQANMNMLAKYDALNREALDRLVEGGTQLRPYSEEILAAAQTAAFEKYDSFAAENPSFKEIYEPWLTFREQVYRWNQTNEMSFASFAYTNL